MLYLGLLLSISAYAQEKELVDSIAEFSKANLGSIEDCPSCLEVAKMEEEKEFDALIQRVVARDFKGCFLLEEEGKLNFYIDDYFGGELIDSFTADQKGLLAASIEEQIKKGVCREPKYEGGFALIDDMLSEKIKGAYIIGNIDGYLQLFLGDDGAVNYVIGRDEEELNQVIKTAIEKGQCHY